MYIKNETNTKDTKGPSTRKKQRENKKPALESEPMSRTGVERS